MEKRQRTLRICPKCEQVNKPTEGFLARLSAPARNALIHAGIIEFGQLATYTEKQILALHGIGPSSIPVLREALSEQNLSFKQ